MYLVEDVHFGGSYVVREDVIWDDQALSVWQAVE